MERPAPDPYFDTRAAREAASFSVPPDSYGDRPLVSGMAVDEPYTKDRDDAMYVASGWLAVHVADTSTTLRQSPGVINQAEQRLRTVYEGTVAAAPMLPPEVSQGALSLGGVERPAVTIGVSVNAPLHTAPHVVLTKVKADIVTPESFVNRLTGDHVAVNALFDTAVNLYKLRHGDAFAEPTLEVETGGDYEVPLHKWAGYLAVQECMIRANTAAAWYMAENDIPGIYRVAHRRPGYSRRAQFTASYQIEPGQHAGLGLELYSPFTSPLRRLPDFVNQANIVAHVLNEPYPYTADKLSDIVGRVRNTRPWDRRKTIAPPYEKALQHIQEDRVTPNELMYVLFDKVAGEPEKLAALRQLAAEKIMAQPSLAGIILHMAFQVKWYVPDKEKLAVTPKVREAQQLEKLSRATGVALVQPVDAPEQVWPADVNPIQWLHVISQQNFRRLPEYTYTYSNKANWHMCTAKLQISDNTTHVGVGGGLTKQAAKAGAAEQVLRSLKDVPGYRKGHNSVTK